MEKLAKERFFARSTLAVLIIAMQNRFIMVETKNESTIMGKLIQADGFGNMWLENSKLTTVTGHKTRFDEIHIKASTVRYVHLPDDVEPIKTITSELSKTSRSFRH